MTIEISPPANPAPKAASSAGAHAAKAGAKTSTTNAGDASADSGATGFMAILGALGDATNDGVAPAADPADALATDATATQVPMDANTLLQQNPQIAAAQAAAQAAQAALLAAGSAEGAMGKAAAGKESNPVGAVGQQGVLLPSPPDGQPLATDAATLPNAATAAAQDRARQGALAASVGKDVEPLEVNESPAQGLQRAGAHAKGGKEKLAQAADSSAAVPVAAAPTERTEWKDSKMMAAIEQAKAAATSRAPEPAFAPLQPKAEKPLSERLASSEKGAEPTYSGTTMGVSGPDFKAVVDSAAAMPAEMQVAEQVTYWVSQNVQNAEMKLDGLGQLPVEVSINVQGNEAQITFRTDEAQTRGVLESAGAHLKDMLQREGMVLTGVSVGTSGRGDASGTGAGSDRRGRSPARHAVIAPLEAVAAPTARRGGLQVGRSLDLFV